MLTLLTNDADAVLALRRYAFTGAPEEIADRLQRIPGTDADVLLDGAEILYAHRDLLDEAGLIVLAQIFDRAIRNGFTAFNQGDRSARIVAAVRRDLGEDGAGVADWDAEDDPAPQTMRREGVDWRPQRPPAPVEPIGPPEL